MNTVPFADVSSADLVVDRVYLGGTAHNRGDDPISKIVSVGNAGGFRFSGSQMKGTVKCLVLYTSASDPDWPDRIDLAAGTFTYYGDNKVPGRELHDTPRKGNAALSEYFDDAQTREGRRKIPPILLFAKAGVGAGATFRGLLVPGSPTVPLDEQLVAIWRSAGEVRFQNYRAIFSILDVRNVSRRWIDQIELGEMDGDAAPVEWHQWRETGVPRRLLAPRSIEHRTREQQLPKHISDLKILQAVYEHFRERPYDFENCAAQIWMMMAPATDELVMTRRSRDGGRDAIGQYRIGPPGDQIHIDFALEAKCYAPQSSVNVKEMSRLISRLRHRNFGVLVTTSWVGGQAYKEIREDRHPIAVVAGGDIVAVLKDRGWGSPEAVRNWLHAEFPAPASVDADMMWEVEHAVEAVQHDLGESLG